MHNTHSLKRIPQTIEERDTALVHRAVQGIQSLDRGLMLLDAFREQPSLTLAQLAAVLPIHRTSTFRLVRTLQVRGFLAQDAEGHFRLGPSLMELGALALDRQQVMPFVRDLVQRIAAATSETVQILIRDGAQVQVVDGIESPHRVKVGAAIGERRPLHATAAGKCFLAYLAGTARARLLWDLERLTPQTIVSPDTLEAELQRVQRQGYAVNDQESEPGARFVAIPVFNGLNRLVAAIAVGAPSNRLSIDAMHQLGQRLATKAF